MALKKKPPSPEELEAIKRASQSFVIEQRIAETLEELGWRVERNIKYEDVKEHKQREMDVIATRAWEREEELVLVQLHLVLEAKSMSGAKIVAAEDTREVTGERCYFEWPGLNDTALREQLRAAVEQSGAPRELIERVLQRVEELAYPAPENYAPVLDLIPEAPKPPKYGTALQIAKGSSRYPGFGLEAALACVDGLTRAATSNAFEDLRDDIRDAANLPDAEELILESVKAMLSLLTVYHPLVVTGALLWTAEGDALTGTAWCRVVDHDLSARQRRWVDVVSLERFGEFADEITRWYDGFFRKYEVVKVTDEGT